MNKENSVTKLQNDKSRAINSFSDDLLLEFKITTSATYIWPIFKVYKENKVEYFEDEKIYTNYLSNVQSKFIENLLSN